LDRLLITERKRITIQKVKIIPFNFFNQINFFLARLMPELSTYDLWV
jgi:hypothetical protein